jgi:hypothetical protein
MYDNTQRSLWLEQAYTEVCKSFGFEAKNVFIGASYPAAGARGDLSRVRPADFDTQWRGNDNERDGFFALHPISFKPKDANDPLGLSTMRAILWSLGRTHHGVRHGASKVGLSKNPDATITADVETDSKLRAILETIGPPPPGHAEPFPVRKTNRSRMVTYLCQCTRDNKIIATNRDKDATCNKCGASFVPR